MINLQAVRAGLFAVNQGVITLDWRLVVIVTAEQSLGEVERVCDGGGRGKKGGREEQSGGR